MLKGLGGGKRLNNPTELDCMQDKCQPLLKGTQSYQFHTTISNANKLISVTVNNRLTLIRRDWWISAASSPFHHCNSLSIFPIQRRLHETRVTCWDTCPKFKHFKKKKQPGLITREKKLEYLRGVFWKNKNGTFTDREAARKKVFKK